MYQSKNYSKIWNVFALLLFIAVSQLLMMSSSYGTQCVLEADTWGDEETGPFDEFWTQQKVAGICDDYLRECRNSQPLLKDGGDPNVSANTCSRYIDELNECLVDKMYELIKDESTDVDATVCRIYIREGTSFSKK